MKWWIHLNLKMNNKTKEFEIAEIFFLTGSVCEM